MKRSYLNVPGQSIAINISGPTGSGKTQIANKLAALFRAEGIVVDAHDPAYKAGVYTDRLSLTCPTPKQAQAMYFETLGEHEIATLKGHLSALGYEL